MKEIHSHLTENFIKELITKENKKFSGVVQVLKIKQNLKDNIVMINLSDGYFYKDFVLIKNKMEEFCREIFEKDIINVRALNYKSRNIRVLFDYEKVYSEVGKIIGNPIEYDFKHENNPNGDNLIPHDIIYKEAEDFKLPKDRNTFEVEITGQNGNAEKFQAHKVIEKSEFTEAMYYIKIANLTCMDKDFRIRGRIQRKGVLRNFIKKDQDEEGHVFNCVINDGSREIQIAFFNEDAVKYYALLEVGKLYSISNGNLRNAGKYNSTNNKIEIICSSKTEILSLPETEEIKKYYFNLVEFEEIKNLENFKTVDILGIIDSIEGIRTITFKNGRESQILTLVLRDGKNKITLALWGDLSSENFKVDSIYLFQSVLVKDYMGKSLSSGNSTRIVRKIPDIPEYKKLLLNLNKKENLENISKNDDNSNFSFKLFSVNQLINYSEELLEDSSLKKYFNVFGNILSIPIKIFYDSCPDDKCKRKVIADTDGSYECNTCHNKFNFPKHRFIANLNFCDDSGSFKCMVNGSDQCKLIFGKEEEDLYNLQNQNEQAYADLIQTRLFKAFKLKIVAKSEYYNNQNLIKYNCISLKSILKTPEFYAKSLYEILTDDFKEKTN